MEVSADVKFGWRLLRRNPGFAIVAALTLALGIGASTAMFSLMRSVLWRPLPFPNPDQLVIVWDTNPSSEILTGAVSAAEYLDWRGMQQDFQGLAALRRWYATLTGRTEAEQIMIAGVSANYFRVFGVQPILGHDFFANDETPGRAQVVLLGAGLWKRRYGGDPKIIGHTIAMDGDLYTVIGVVPDNLKTFFWTDVVDAWVPLQFTHAQLNRADHELIVIGRIKDGLALSQAQAEMATIRSRLKRQYPAVDQDAGMRVVRLDDDTHAKLRPAFMVLAAGVLLVLMIACANVANLLLVRAASREREIAIRAAIGAGRWRIFRQLLTESGVLALAGGALGIGLGYALVRAMPWMGVDSLIRPASVEMDLSALGFVLGISVSTGLLFGLAPALQASRGDLHQSLKEGGRGATAGRTKNRLRSALVVSETAISLVLLIGAGLLIRSFARLSNVDIGFNPSSLLTAQIQLPWQRYSAQQARNFYQAFFARAAALPGVEAASGANSIPMTSWRMPRGFDIEGQPPPPPGEEYQAEYSVVEQNYPQVMGVKLEEGREFSPADGPYAPGVVLINDALRRRYWPNTDPVGQRIRPHPGTASPYEAAIRQDWLTIVGVVGNVRNWSIGPEPLPHMYFPEEQAETWIMRPMLRTHDDPERVASALRHITAELDPELPVAFVQPMDEFVSAALTQKRMSTVLLGLFAGIALLLAAVGIYSVMAYVTAQRTHEIGIRMALGAVPADVRRMILRDGMRLAAVGLGIGLVGAAALVPYLRSLLYGVSIWDAPTFIVTTVLLGGVAAAASCIPARRATRVDPLTALRYE